MLEAIFTAVVFHRCGLLFFSTTNDTSVGVEVDPAGMLLATTKVVRVEAESTLCAMSVGSVVGSA